MFFQNGALCSWSKNPGKAKICDVRWSPPPDNLPQGHGGKEHDPHFSYIAFNAYIEQTIPPVPTSPPADPVPTLRIAASSSTSSLHFRLLCFCNKTMCRSNRFCPKQNVTISVTCSKTPPDSSAAQNIMLYRDDIIIQIICSQYIIYNIKFDIYR